MNIDLHALEQTIAPVESYAEEPNNGEFDANGNLDSSPSLPSIIDSATFSIESLPDPAEIIKGILHQGTKIIIGGGSKSYKTWIQLDCAISIAYGLSWLGCESFPGRVLFINFEIQPSFFQRRIQKLCSARGIVQQPGRLDIWNLRGHCAPYRIIIPQIAERIKANNYSVVFLDPVYKLYGNTNENDASEVAQLLNSFEHLAVETNAAVAFGAHYSKGNQAAKESIDRISGSGVFARDPDSIIGFTRHQDDDAFVVEPILRNLPPMKPFVVRWKFPLMVRDDNADPTQLRLSTTKPRQHDPLNLLSFIKSNPADNPISTTAWADLANLSRSTLEGYLPEMRNNGWIQTVGDGRQARKAITTSGLKALENIPKSTAGI